MRLITRGPRAPLHTATPLLDQFSPRKRAIDWLQGKIADGTAGLDPADPTVLIVEAGPNEKVWGYRALELCGIVLDSVTSTSDGGRRIRAVIEVDVRQELGLDKLDRPWLFDPPARRMLYAVPTNPADLRDATVAEIRDEPTPVLVAMLDGGFGELSATTLELARQELAGRNEPESLLALRHARAAYDRRYPDGPKEAS
jgi:hypothetical protein